jgi:hypothetical protein
MMGPSRSFPSARKHRHCHGCLKTFGIHASGSGLETDIHTFCPAQRTIAGNRAGIRGQVFTLAELGRIDKDAHDERIAL